MRALCSKRRRQDGGLEIGHARYETLILPATSYVSPEIEAARQKALSAGLTVCQNDWEALEPQKPLKICDQNGEEIREIWALWRETDERNLLFFTNTGAQKSGRAR